MRYEVEVAGSVYRIDAEEREGEIALRVDGDERAIHCWKRETDGIYFVRLGDRTIGIHVSPADRTHLVVRAAGTTFPVRVEDERELHLRELGGVGGSDSAVGEEVNAPMPGRVVTVPVAIGETIEAGQTVVVLEAMKMENEIRAESSGRVALVDVAAGENVDIGQRLVRIEPMES